MDSIEFVNKLYKLAEFKEYFDIIPLVDLDNKVTGRARQNLIFRIKDGIWGDYALFEFSPMMRKETLNWGFMDSFSFIMQHDYFTSKHSNLISQYWAAREKLKTTNPTHPALKLNVHSQQNKLSPTSLFWLSCWNNVLDLTYWNRNKTNILKPNLLLNIAAANIDNTKKVAFLQMKNNNPEDIEAYGELPVEWMYSMLGLEKPTLTYQPPRMVVPGTY